MRVERARQLLSRLEHAVRFSDPFLVLDVGCGDGVQSFVFLERFQQCKVIGIDVDEYVVLEAMKNNGLFHDRFQGLIGDFHELPFLSGLFDLILFGFSLHETKNKIKALKEAWKVLKHRGIIFIMDYQVQSPTYWIPLELKISPAALLQLIRKHLSSAAESLIFSNERFYIIKVTKHDQARS